MSLGSENEKGIVVSDSSLNLRKFHLKTPLVITVTYKSNSPEERSLMVFNTILVLY